MLVCRKVLMRNEAFACVCVSVSLDHLHTNTLTYSHLQFHVAVYSYFKSLGFLSESIGAKRTHKKVHTPMLTLTTCHISHVVLFFLLSCTMGTCVIKGKQPWTFALKMRAASGSKGDYFLVKKMLRLCKDFDPKTQQMCFKCNISSVTLKEWTWKTGSWLWWGLICKVLTLTDLLVCFICFHCNAPHAALICHAGFLLQSFTNDVFTVCHVKTDVWLSNVL